MEESGEQELQDALDTCDKLIGAWTSGGYPQRSELGRVRRMRGVIVDLIRKHYSLESSSDFTQGPTGYD